jgi:xylulose-5-phosphate/fructose-6-phosphate phosphoketolase
VPGLAASGGVLHQEMADTRLRARAYAREHGEDVPEISGWQWEPVAEVAP